FSAEAIRHLETYSWPGNVRELENCVRYLTSLRLDRAVRPGDLRLIDGVSLGHPSPASAPIQLNAESRANGQLSLREAKRRLITHFERDFVIDAVRAGRGNIAHAARASGKTRRAFFELMRKYSISANDYR